MPILPYTNISVPKLNLSDLASTDVSKYNSGVITCVIPHVGEYLYDKESVEAADGTFIVEPLSTVGRWYLISSPITATNYALTNADYGVATLVDGTVTVPYLSASINTIILLTAQSTGSGSISVGTITPDTEFTIESSDVLDARVIAWLAINNG